jgi:arylsulfatase A-like enzyme
MSEGFDFYYDNFDLEQLKGTNPGNVQRKAEETIDQVLPWLEEVRRPFFLWVHLFDPHHSYSPPPPFDKRYSSNLYAGEVAYVDQQVGRLFQTLKNLSLYEDSLIIATSDHGESLGEHGEDEHGFFLYEAAIRIPLILKLPLSYDVRSYRIDTIAQTIDLLPTPGRLKEEVCFHKSSARGGTLGWPMRRLITHKPALVGVHSESCAKVITN